MILELLAGVPVRLPVHPDLLQMHKSRARFHDIKGLHLHAWPLSGVGIERLDFQTKLLDSCPEAEGSLHSRFTLVVSGPTTSGVRRRALIQPVLL